MCFCCCCYCCSIKLQMIFITLFLLYYYVSVERSYIISVCSTHYSYYYYTVLLRFSIRRSLFTFLISLSLLYFRSFQLCFFIPSSFLSPSSLIYYYSIIISVVVWRYEWQSKSPLQSYYFNLYDNRHANSTPYPIPAQASVMRCTTAILRTT